MSDTKTSRRVTSRELAKAAAAQAAGADISPIAIAAVEDGAALAQSPEITITEPERSAPADTVEAAAGPEPKPETPEPLPESATASLYAFRGEALAAISESQAAAMRGLHALATEIDGLARSGFAAVTESATAMLGAKTLADAIEVQSRFARRSVDAAIEGSAKLSEIGVRLTTEASQPLLSGFGDVWKSTRLR